MLSPKHNQFVANILMPERPFRYLRWRRLPARRGPSAFYYAVSNVMASSSIPVSVEKMRINILPCIQPVECEPCLQFEWRVYTDTRQFSEDERVRTRSKLGESFAKEIWEHVVEGLNLMPLHMILPGDIFPLDKLIDEQMVAE